MYKFEKRRFNLTFNRRNRAI